MARVSLSDTHLRVEPEGLHQLWALTRRIEVPLAHVRGATADPGIVAESKGVRAPGLALPGLGTIGTFHRDGERFFWDVTTGASAVVIQLLEERYTALVVQVRDPRAVVEAVNGALARAGDGATVRAPAEAGLFRAVLDGSGQPAPRRMRQARRWGPAVAAAVAVEAAVKTVMLADVQRRPAEALRGSKRTWRALAWLNGVGPLAYFAYGRRPVDRRRSAVFRRCAAPPSARRVARPHWGGRRHR